MVSITHPAESKLGFNFNLMLGEQLHLISFGSFVNIAVARQLDDFCFIFQYTQMVAYVWIFYKIVGVQLMT